MGAPQVYADCANPAAVEADTLYNADDKTMQYCDGGQWWAMKGIQVSLPACPEGDGIIMSSAGWACSAGGPP